MTAPVTSNSDIMGGLPCVAGTRVPARAIWDFYALGGVAAVMSAYPRLTRDEIGATVDWCLANPGKWERKAKRRRGAPAYAAGYEAGQIAMRERAAKVAQAHDLSIMSSTAIDMTAAQIAGEIKLLEVEKP